MIFHRSRTVLLAAAAAAALQAGGALAQAERDYRGGYTPALPDFTDELGVRYGSFVLRPEATVSLDWSDNIYFADDEQDPESDFILQIAPTLTLESEWNRHAAKFAVGGAYGMFFDNTDDNYVHAFGQAQGTYDVSRVAAIRATLRADRLHERRGAIDADTASLEPVTYSVFAGRVEGRYKPNRIRLSPFAEYSYRDYDDADLRGGLTQNNDDRDRSRATGGLEVGYEFLRGYEAFLRGQVDQVTYDDSVDDNGFRRDSVGVKALTGVKFDLTRLITADLGVGFVHRDYDDALLDELSGFTASAKATWSVTPLTTVIFFAERDIEETTVTQASGAFTTKGEVEVVHSLRRDLLVSSFANVIDRDFEGGFRQETSAGLGLGAEWSLNRNLTLEGRYEFSRREASGVGRDFTNNAVSIGLSAKY